MLYTCSTKSGAILKWYFPEWVFFCDALGRGNVKHSFPCCVEGRVFTFIFFNYESRASSSYLTVKLMCYSKTSMSYIQVIQSDGNKLHHTAAGLAENNRNFVHNTFISL